MVHTASPVLLTPPKDENEQIKPAVNGMQAIMEASHFYKVKRVVFTSGIAAMIECKPQDRPVDGKFTE